ncbi:MAG TPA: YitT family protein [Candidatus Enterocloster excrementipullorum]|uniref:YitT family protein n=1 Tax=Candidatus Enterocloster excrementipullorum TaxID=2838559 RepID=A0A9D2N235_9FIRM|nr:YitT family protein [Candidatus Enterocloster excrementipullorum]
MGGLLRKTNAAIEYGIIVLGTAIMAFAIKNIYDPVSMVTGGVSGLAIIFKEMWGVPLWLTNTLLNVPLFAAAYFIMGWKFIKRTLFATVLLSLFLYVLPVVNLTDSDMLLSALFGGILSGIGTGLLFLVGCTTGGTDMLAVLIQRAVPYYTVAQVMQVLDGMIVAAGALVFGIPAALYAMIAIFCLAKVTDGIIEGLKFSKQAYIISDQYEEIAQAVMSRMGRGVTSLEARGMYSGQEKKVLFCVVSKKELVELRQITAEFDPRAFMIVNDAREVFGEGFIE